MKAFGVATHVAGYFREFMESSNKHGINLTILGFGEEWQGFLWKFSMMLEALDDVSDEEVVLFTDAYDVIFLAGPEEIENKFKQLDVDFLVSGENGVANPIINVMYQEVMMNPRVKGCDYNCSINSGMYMGYARAVKSVLRTILNYVRASGISDANDQSQLVLYSKMHPGEISIDYDSTIFYNQLIRPFNSHISIKNHEDLKIVQNSTRLYNTKTEEFPCIFHAPGNMDMSEIIIQQGLTVHYEDVDLFTSKTWHYTKKTWPHIVLTLALISILFLIFQCQKSYVISKSHSVLLSTAITVVGWSYWMHLRINNKLPPLRMIVGYAFVYF